MAQNWRIGLSDRIDPARTGPLYMQIIEAVIRDIQRGRLTPGTYLPSSRELASTLGVNRKTVVLAYEDLVAQGWLATSATRGTMVSEHLPEAIDDRPQDDAPGQSSATKTAYTFKPPPDRPLALRNVSGLKIDEGTPDGRLFLPETLAKAYRSAVHQVSRSNGLQYRDPRGTPELRCAIADMLRIQRGLPVNDSNICITRGSQNGIFLTASALLGPGDAVIVESLTYEPAVAAFRTFGARIFPVGLDDGGMDVDAVDEICRKERVKAVFVTPHHQFPTTVALRPNRRLRLVDLARNYGFAIIEDDYDHEFHFQSQPLLPVAAYAPEEVVYIGSLSKLLLPALRIGYVAAPASMIDALAHMVSVSDGMGNSITETATARLIETGEVRRHARKARKIYAERREHFASTLRAALGDRVQFDLPDGGLALWLKFRGNLEVIEQRAAQSNLHFASHESFKTRGDAPSGLRLGFASLDKDEAVKAIDALDRAAR